MSEITHILESLTKADGRHRSEELLPLVYDQLRQLAASKLAREAPGQTLQATALVHEAWLRLAGGHDQQWQNRAHFFAAAAEAMRRILVENARRKARLKRGDRPAFEELHESRIESQAPSEEVLAVHEALDPLTAEDPLAAEVVKLRYFVGRPIPEVAKALYVVSGRGARLWVVFGVVLKGYVGCEWSRV